MKVVLNLLLPSALFGGNEYHIQGRVILVFEGNGMDNKLSEATHL